MDAKYQNLIDTIRRGEGEETRQQQAVKAAIDELTAEAKEIDTLVIELRQIARGMYRGNWLEKQRAAYEASQAKGGE